MLFWFDFIGLPGSAAIRPLARARPEDMLIEAEEEGDTKKAKIVVFFGTQGHVDVDLSTFRWYHFVWHLVSG